MNLQKKITTLCVGIVVLITIAVGMLMVLQKRNLTKQNEQSTETYNKVVGEMSATSMTEQVQQRMTDVTNSNAKLANAKFEELENQVTLLANVTSRIFSNPQDYASRDIPLPDAANDGSLSVQLLQSEKVADADASLVKQRIGLLGNLQETIYEVNNNFTNMASDYVAVEPGILIQADYIAASKFDEDGTILPYEADTRPWYRGAKEAKDTYFTSVSQDAHTNEKGIMCGVPIYVNDEFIGVAGAGMYLSDIDELVSDIRIGSAGYACIVNQNGEVIFSPKEDGELMIDTENQSDLRSTENTDLGELINKVLSGENGIRMLKLDGENYYIAYAPMTTVGWGFLTVLAEDEVLRPTNELLQEMDESSVATKEGMRNMMRASLLALLTMLFVFCLLAAMFAFLLSRHIVKPIQQLTKTISKMDGDNLDFTWELKDQKDETSILAGAFLDMTQKMKEYINHITEITAEKERIGAELNVATKIQADMLPKIFPAFPGQHEFDVYAQMQPAKEVGGDFYDFFMIDNDHLAIVIADVSSKGVPAALFMVIAKTLIKNHALNQEPLNELFYKVNNQLCEGNEEGMFVTAWMGVLTVSTGSFEYINAGHNPQLLMNNEQYDWIEANPGFVLAGMEGIPYQSATVQLKHGARIFLYTDGVTEAQNAAHELFGEDRLLESLAVHGKKPLQEMLEHVRSDIDTFAGDVEQFDDITMLVFEYK